MKSEIDFERLLAEGRAIEIAEQMGTNAGRIDALEQNPYGKGISEAREDLRKITGMFDKELYVNFWAVFESAYDREWGKGQGHSSTTNN